MDKSEVLAYIARLDNEWNATDKVISDAFTDMRIDESGKRTTPDLPFSMYDWRADFYAWGKWKADVSDDWWIGADEYNAAREWHLKLREWQSKIPLLMKPVVLEEVPKEEPGVADVVKDTGANVGKGIGAGMAAAAAAALIYVATKGRQR